MKVGARFAALSAVAARVTTVPASASSFFNSGIGRGVVVATICGAAPSLSANCSMSHVFCGCRHLATSSHQAASNCGPRRPSGSSAENICAIAPDAQISCPFDGSKRGRSPAACTRKKPRHALDHHAAHLVDRLADERDAPRSDRTQRRAPQRLGAHPFGTGARLAGAAPAHDEPHAPGLPVLGGLRRQLVGRAPTAASRTGSRRARLSRNSPRSCFSVPARAGCAQSAR